MIYYPDKVNDAFVELRKTVNELGRFPEQSDEGKVLDAAREFTRLMEIVLAQDGFVTIAVHEYDKERKG